MLDITKTCTKCKQTKNISEFHHLSVSKDGFHSQCKSCKNAYDRSRNAQHREYARKYTLKHPGWHTRYTYAWREKTTDWKERHNKQWKEYYYRNHERYLELARIKMKRYMDKKRSQISE